MCALVVLFCVVWIAACSTVANAIGEQCDVGSQWYGSDCWCSPSYYSPDGHAPCNPCDNSFNTVIGSSSCTCNPGYVSTTGNAPCSKCGEHSDTFGKNSWQDWEYSNNFVYESLYGKPSMLTEGNPGRTSCVCAMGAFGVGGRQPCTLCPPNSNSHHYDWHTWRIVPAKSFCLCSPGFWNVNGGHPQDSDPCMPCPAYSYSEPGSRSGPSSQSCPLCLANAYRETAGAACQPCPTGTTGVAATTAVGLASCAKCDIGYYSPTGNSPCMPCEEGFTTIAIGQVTCWPWDAVHTGNPSRSPTAAPTGPSAKPSPRPSAAPTTRKTSRPSAMPTMQPTHPDDCPPGFHSPTGKGPDCKRCPKGTTNNDYGQFTCPLCRDGYFSRDGTTPCARCPTGWSSSALWGHTDCVACVGYTRGCRKPQWDHHRHANGTTNYLRGVADEVDGE